jgi:hypothetical protein
MTQGISDPLPFGRSCVMDIAENGELHNKQRSRREINPDWPTQQGVVRRGFLD